MSFQGCHQKDITRTTLKLPFATSWFKSGDILGPDLTSLGLVPLKTSWVLTVLAGNFLVDSGTTHFLNHMQFHFGSLYTVPSTRRYKVEFQTFHVKHGSRHYFWSLSSCSLLIDRLQRGQFFLLNVV